MDANKPAAMVLALRAAIAIAGKLALVMECLAVTDHK